MHRDTQIIMVLIVKIVPESLSIYPLYPIWKHSSGNHSPSLIKWWIYHPLTCKVPHILGQFPILPCLPHFKSTWWELFCISTHFLLRHKYWARYVRTGCMIRQGREERSWTDYLMGTNSHLFRNAFVQDPQHDLEHFMVLGWLHGATQREHFIYLWQSRRFPLRPMW